MTRGKDIHIEASVLLKLLSQLKRTTSAFLLPGEPVTWPTAEPIQKYDHHWLAPYISAANYRYSKRDWLHL